MVKVAIQMEPCKNLDNFYLTEWDKEDRHNIKGDDIIIAHQKVGQFFCPKAFDLSMYGSKGDILSKILSVELTAQNRNVLEGRSILLIVNNAKIDYEGSFVNPKVVRYSSHHWIPVTPDNPTTTTVTFETNRYIKP